MHSIDVLVPLSVHVLDFSFSDMCFSWLCWNSFSLHFLSLFLCFNLLCVVLSNSFYKCLSTFTLSDVFYSEMNSLWDYSVTYSFIDNDTNCMRGHIEYSTSLSVIVLVWHAFLNRSVCKYIDVITHLINSHVSLKINRSVLSEFLREQISSFTPETEGVRHIK